MKKKIGLFWLRDDFRFTQNHGLIEATENHDQVVVFYLYKQDIFKNQEAQKWWLSKSLFNFRKELNKLNIALEIIQTNSFKIFFDNLTKKNDFKLYWNKVYEPEYLKFDKYLSNIFKNKNIIYKRFKGNTLNEIDEIKKAMEHRSKYLPLFGELQKNIILKKYHQKKRQLKNVKIR